MELPTGSLNKLCQYIRSTISAVSAWLYLPFVLIVFSVFYLMLLWLIINEIKEFSLNPLVNSDTKTEIKQFYFSFTCISDVDIS